MIASIQDFFRNMAETYPKWNFIFFHDPTQWERVVSGLMVTIQLSVVCVIPVSYTHLTLPTIYSV